MPNLITHYYFAKKVEKDLSPTAKEITASCPDAFKLGSMGPDYLFILRELGFKEKRYPNSLQYRKVFETFESTANYLNKNPDKTMLSYMLGFICHYAADRLAHAYVYYFCEEVMHKRMERRYHTAMHTLIESAMDCKVLENEGEDYTKYPAHTVISAPKKIRLKIGKLYEDAINDIYGIDLTPKRAALGFKLSEYLLRFAMDRTGLKKKIIGLWEDGEKRKKRFTSHMRPPACYGEADYFNEGRTPWRKVRNGEETVDHTIWEVLELCRKDAIRLIDEYLAWVFEGKPMKKEEFNVNFEGVDLSRINF